MRRLILTFFGVNLTHQNFNFRKKISVITANRLVKLLEEKGKTIAFAESVTAGLACAKLAVYKGVSDVLRGSVVCYTPEVKCSLLKVPQSVIGKFSCESQEVTDGLAKGLQKIMPADIHVAITGLAAPGGSETKDKPVGTVFFSVLIGKSLHRRRNTYSGTPSEIREKACEGLFEFVLELIK